MDQDYPNSPPVDESRNQKATLQSTEPWRFPVLASLVRDGTIAPLAKVLYIALQSYVSESSPMPFPSLETLSKHTGATIKTVQRHLKELETHRLISRAFVKDAGKWHATRYTLFPHKPKGKKKRRPLVNFTTGQKRPSSITHSSKLELVTKTPPPEPAPKLVKFTPFHPSNCHCVDCRKAYIQSGIDFGQASE